MKNLTRILAATILFALASTSPACSEPGNIGLGSIEYTCGDNRVEGQESCDGPDLNGKTCRDMSVAGVPGQTYLRGQLGCASDCKSFVVSGCAGYCGDGVRDTAAMGGIETCDGSDVGGATCRDFEVPDMPGRTFYRGQVRCEADCSAYVLEGCEGYCGDGTIDPDGLEGAEACDGANLGTTTCQDVPVEGMPDRRYYSGSPACTDDCRALLRGTCSGYCGDDVLQADAPDGGEICDGARMNGLTCSDVAVPDHPGQQYYSGIPECATDCRGLEVGTCTGFCGNGQREPDASGTMERCDGKDLGGATCADKGCQSGSPHCLNDCSDIDFTACKKCCGDGHCDSPVENNQTCPNDCFCGDGWCDASNGETRTNCPDCKVCGDGFCDEGETATSCCKDCQTSGQVKFVGDVSDTAFLAVDCDICNNPMECLNGSHALDKGQSYTLTLADGECVHVGAVSGMTAGCHALSDDGSTYPAFCFSQDGDCGSANVCMGPCEGVLSVGITESWL